MYLGVALEVTPQQSDFFSTRTLVDFPLACTAITEIVIFCSTSSRRPVCVIGTLSLFHRLPMLNHLILLVFELKKYFPLVVPKIGILGE